MTRFKGVYLGRKRQAKPCACGRMVTEYRDYERKVAHVRHGDDLKEFNFNTNPQEVREWVDTLHAHEARLQFRTAQAAPRRAGGHPQARTRSDGPRHQATPATMREALHALSRPAIPISVLYGPKPQQEEQNR